jgi:transposase
MAEISGVSRQTVNALLARLRGRIAGLAEAESPFAAGEIEIDESYFASGAAGRTPYGAKRVRGERGRGVYGKTKVVGMLKWGDKVYTQVVRNCSAPEPVPIIRKPAPDESAIYSDEWKAYDGLVNAGYRHRYRVKHSDDVFANGRACVNGMENFWGVAKTGLARLRGIRPDKFYLHLKETEFRLNHRRDDLYSLLLREFRKSPP